MRRKYICYYALSAALIASLFILPPFISWLGQNAYAKESIVLAWVVRIITFSWSGALLPFHFFLATQLTNKHSYLICSIVMLLTIAIFVLLYFLIDWKYDKQMTGGFMVTTIFEFIYLLKKGISKKAAY